MYISNAILFIFFIFILLSITFIITMTRTRQITLLHKFYFAAITSLIVWILAIFAIRCTNPGDIRTLELLDVVTTTCAAMIPPFSLLFVVCYINKYERTIPKQYWTVFIVPIVTAMLVFTNPLTSLVL